MGGWLGQREGLGCLEIVRKWVCHFCERNVCRIVCLLLVNVGCGEVIGGSLCSLLFRTRAYCLICAVHMQTVGARLAKTTNTTRTPPHNKPGIYQLKCNTRNLSFIGQTSHNLKTRYHEHIRYIKNNNAQSHLNNTTNCYSTTSTRGDNTTQLSAPEDGHMVAWNMFSNL